MKQIVLILLFAPIILLAQVKPIDSISKLEDIKINSKKFNFVFTKNADSTYRLILRLYFPRKAIKEFANEIYTDSLLSKCDGKFENNLTSKLSTLIIDNISIKHTQLSYYDSTLCWLSNGLACFIQGNSTIINKKVLFSNLIKISSRKNVSFSMSVEWDTKKFIFLNYNFNTAQTISSNRKVNEIIKRKMKRTRNYKEGNKQKYSLIISTEKRHVDFLHFLENHSYLH